MKTIVSSEVLYVLTPLHLCLLILFVSWPILYVLIFTTQPDFILGDTQNFLKDFGTNGTGSVIVTGSGNLENTLLSDKGRQTVLWVSFVISLLMSILVYLLTFYS